MVLNDYECTGCGHAFEAWTGPETVLCPECGAGAKRVFSPLACHGLSDGPGSKTSHYRKADLKQEVKEQLAAMERAGHLRDPQKMKQAEATLKQIKDMPDSRTQINYDKEGYPF